MTAELVCIASDYCSEIIELNLKSITESTTIALEKLKSLKKARDKIAHCAMPDSDLDIDNDEQLINYLYKIYAFQLDNDKYGINKRA